MRDEFRPVPPGRPARRSGAWLDRSLHAAVIMGVLVALIWVLEMVDAATGHSLDPLAISPRDADELPQILTAPFLHFGYGHVAANSVPLFVLGFLAAVRGIGAFLVLSLVIVVVGGFGVWLTAPEGTLTAGSSILVFGYLGYLLARGYYYRQLPDILVAVVVALLYGAALWGVLPGQAGISWQGHLFGLIGGVLTAKGLRESGH